MLCVGRSRTCLPVLDLHRFAFPGWTFPMEPHWDRKPKNRGRCCEGLSPTVLWKQGKQPAGCWRVPCRGSTHPARCQTAGLLSLEELSGILTLAFREFCHTWSCTFLCWDAQIFPQCCGNTLKYFWCWSAGFGFALRSWRSDFRGVGKGCSGHLADI